MGSGAVDVTVVSRDVSVELGTVEEGTSEKLGISARKSGTKAIDGSVKIGA